MDQNPLFALANHKIVQFIGIWIAIGQLKLKSLT